MDQGSVRRLFPSEEVQECLSAANEREGYKGLAAAVEACNNPAELRWVVLRFRRWADATSSADSKLQSAWDDLCALSDVFARLQLRHAHDFQWKGRERAVSTVSTSMISKAQLEHAGPGFRQAFESSVELAEERRQAAAALSFSRIPLEWAPLASAMQSERQLEQKLRQLLGRSPYEALEQNLSALEQALPLPASAQETRVRLLPDVATLRRLARLWSYCCARLKVALDAWALGLNAAESASKAESPALGRCFAQATVAAVCRARELLFRSDALQPDLPLSSWWQGGSERAEPLAGHQALMLDLLRSGLPLPGALRTLLLEQVESALLALDIEELEDEHLSTILVASFSGDQDALMSLLKAAKEAEDAWLGAGLGLTMVMTEAAGFQQRRLLPGALHRLAWVVSCAWHDPGVAWEGDWLSRWWFAVYQARVRESRCLPSPLGPVTWADDGTVNPADYFGLEPGVLPPDDVDASALWCLWLCLRNTYGLVPDVDRNSRIWPDCIRRLGREGFASTALCLFECWLTHQGIFTASLSEESDESFERMSPALPDDDDLLALVRDLKEWVSPGRLDGILHFAASCLRQGEGRYPYLAEQLEAQASTVHKPVEIQARAVVQRIQQLEPDRKLVRDRLREQMVGFERLPQRLQDALADSERVRDVRVGDEVEGSEVRDSSSWAHMYGKVVEGAVREAFGRVGDRNLLAMYRAGGGKAALQGARPTLGQVLWVLDGAKTKPDWQQMMRDHRIQLDALNRDWRDRLRWIVEKRNLASHSEPMERTEADAWRVWMFRDFVKWVEPLGILHS
jgi:hypothetical protein